MENVSQLGDAAAITAAHVKPMHTVHLDFAELEKKRDSIGSTKSFLVGIDRNTRYAFAKACKENAKAVIQFLSQKGFETVKRIVSDRARVFESRESCGWAKHGGIEGASVERFGRTTDSGRQNVHEHVSKFPWRLEVQFGGHN